MKHNKVISVGVFSKATSVPGQGVGAAYIEQLNLIQQSKKLNVVLKGTGKLDLIHIHTVNFRYWIAMLFIGIPKVVYVHFLPSTLATSIKLPRIFFGILKWYIKKFYQTASYLVVVNPIFIDPLVKMGIKKERIKFIPNFVDESKFTITESRTTIRKSWKFKRFTVLGVGQVQHRKGVLDFIETAKRLPNLDFVWAGGFSFKGLTAGYEELKEVMENPPANVRFLGIIPREKMKELYHGCDLFFLPSFDELMPMSVLEAAVCNKPILLRDLELYQPVFHGQYLSAHSIDGFVKIMKQLSEDDQFYKQSLAHPTWLKEHYQRAPILEKWEAYYQEVLDQHAKTHQHR
ncbi:MAG: glycosyltransferase family 4 protein [Bacilli bacterium]